MSLRQVEMQYKVFSLMLQARNMMLHNMGHLKQYVFLLLQTINFITTGYRQDLQEEFGAVVCVFVF